MGVGLPLVSELCPQIRRALLREAVGWPDPMAPLAWTSTSMASIASMASLSTNSAASTAWFLVPDTWKLDHQLQVPHVYDAAELRAPIRTIQCWLRRWTTTGSCPFVHACVYGARMPDSVQVAFAALTSYVHRTAATTDLVLRIVEEQASRLGSLKDSRRSGGANGDASGDASCGFSAGASSLCTDADPPLVDQLARTHALLVFQVIALFDGDIRARHRAEARRDLLARWSTQLLECAARRLPAQARPTDPVPTATPGDLLGDSPDVPPSAWRLWVLGESARRTWLVAASIESIYGVLQHGTYPCPGNLPFTTRHGLWEARSAAAWEARCAATAAAPARLAHRLDCEPLFGDAAAEIDEFARAMMALTFGTDRVALWEGSSRTLEGNVEGF